MAGPEPQVSPADATGDSERDRLRAERDDLLALLERARADRAAGDLDPADADALEDDYTARIAALTRSINGGPRKDPKSGTTGTTPDTSPTGGGGSRNRAVIWVALVVLFSLVAGVLVVQSAGRRGIGETFTGDIRQNTRDLLLAARDQIASGEFNEALQTYADVLELAPANVEAITYSAWVSRTLLRQTDDQTALDELGDALAIDPNYPDARVFTAIILRDMGRFDEAAEALDGLDPDDVPDFLVLQVEALRLEVSGASPDRIDIVRAEAATRTGNFAEALRLLDGVIERSPDNVEALVAKADVLLVVSTATTGADRELLLGNALELVDRAAAVDPADPAPQLYRALVLELQGDTTGALAIVDALEAGGNLDPAVRSEIAALRNRLGG